MAQVSKIYNGVQNTHTFPNLHKPQKPKSLKSLWLGSELKAGSLTSLSLYHQVVYTNLYVSVRVPLGVSASVATTAEKPSRAPEIVLQPIKEISGTVTLPGSKSLSNRILLLAALSEGTTVVDNLLNSDDVHYMLGGLRTLGIHVEEDSSIK